MNGFSAICKKELRRFFTDTRMLVTVLLLPGVLIYVMYTVMGSAMGDMFTVREDYTYKIGVSERFEFTVYAELWGDVPVSFYHAAPDVGKPKVADGTLDLYVAFDDNFWTDVALYDVSSQKPAPQAAIYFNSAETTSQNAYSVMVSFLNRVETSLSNRLDINRDPDTYDMAAAEDTSAMFFSMLMPMFLTMMLFTGAQAVATESIAGEKERGTMATLLVTPLKRSSLALGKIAALTVIAVTSGVVTTCFTIASLPKIVDSVMTMDAAIYSVGDYILLGLVLVSTAVVYVTVISLLSTFAKSVKEAQALVTPLMMGVILLGLTSMFTGEASGSIGLYFIPLYNSVQSITGIFAADPWVPGILVTAAVNFVVAGAGVVVLARMMGSERIMSK